ncbi:MAG: urease accessory protein UreD [Firmicutes bacterium]|jgi:urease accessory protein UreH|uniref:Urease accessory protein UreD n=1 Tax=Sulfobacillus benefaciens TaxID=453960 RepID=A0A2T2X0K3_9FIRM|nr:urease accessory protein UreD [Bacillota bacterium]MCL5014961.1 urease accessory protein UreD [Bacillota bacterium]PSR28006.1 MAG: hypothetical protein C7B43_10640 [Sulfobacillus benefaciens]
MKKQRIRVYPNRIETYFEPPLQLFVLKETPPFHVMSAEFAGVLEGDRFETEIIVEPGAYVLLSTREASKLMSMPAQGARHDWRIVLRANAQLVSLPHEIIPFAQSDFTQSVHCELEPGASLVWGEVVIAGRLARHEYFQFRHFHSRLTITPTDSSIPLYHDNLCLKPGQSGLRHGEDNWGSFGAWGSLVAIRNDATRDGFTSPPLEYALDIRSRPYSFEGKKEGEQQLAGNPVRRQYQGLSALQGGFIWRMMADQPEDIHDRMRERAKDAESQKFPAPETFPAPKAREKLSVSAAFG